MQSGNNAAATANGVRKSCVRGGVDAMDTSESIANSGLTTTTTLATSSNQCGKNLGLPGLPMLVIVS